MRRGNCGGWQHTRNNLCLSLLVMTSRLGACAILHTHILNVLGSGGISILWKDAPPDGSISNTNADMRSTCMVVPSFNRLWNFETHDLIAMSKLKYVRRIDSTPVHLCRCMCIMVLLSVPMRRYRRTFWQNDAIQPVCLVTYLLDFLRYVL